MVCFISSILLLFFVWLQKFKRSWKYSFRQNWRTTMSSHSLTKEIHGDISQLSEASCSVKLKTYLRLMSRSKMHASQIFVLFQTAVLEYEELRHFVFIWFFSETFVVVCVMGLVLKFYFGIFCVSVLGLHVYSHKCFAYFLTNYGDQTRCTRIDMVGQQQRKRNFCGLNWVDVAPPSYQNTLTL